MGVIGLGGSVFGGVQSVWGDAIFGGSVWVDRSLVVMRSWWWCEIYGGAGVGVRSVLGGLITFSLSLSLCASETRKWFVVKIKM